MAYVDGFVAAVPAANKESYLDHARQALPLPDALSRLRRNNSHLALVTAPGGAVTAVVALEDLVEDLVGTVRDGTHRV